MAGRRGHRAEPPVLAVATSGSRGPAAARGTEQKVAGPGEATMKPSSEEEEELVQGVGPWDECFEVAVQLALRAGQVSAVAASSLSELQETPEMGGVDVLRARGRERSEFQGQGLCCFWAHLSLVLHTHTGGRRLAWGAWGSAPRGEGRSHRKSTRDPLLIGRWNGQALGT